MLELFVFSVELNICQIYWIFRKILKFNYPARKFVHNINSTYDGVTKLYLNHIRKAYYKNNFKKRRLIIIVS